MKFEAYCTKCGKVLDISKEVEPDQETALLMAAQFKKCPDCHKYQDFAYYQIGVRPVAEVKL